jgi:aminopeptidase N
VEIDLFQDGGQIKIKITTMGAKIQAFDIFQTPLSSHYPLPLRDIYVLFLDFSAGAMENWGLITYREVALLYQEGE